MTLNKDKVHALLGQVGETVATLESYRSISAEVLLGDRDKLGNIKYQFVMAAEACIDLCNHIAAKGLFDNPDSYSKCFDVLHRHGVIEKDLAERMSSFARFRNLLVHRYWQVDDRKVVDSLQNLDVLRSFAASIAKYATVNGDSRGQIS